MLNVYLRRAMNPRKLGFWILLTLVFSVSFFYTATGLRFKLDSYYNDSISKKLEEYYNSDLPEKMEIICLISYCRAIVVEEDDINLLYLKRDEDGKLNRYRQNVTEEVISTVTSGLHTKFEVEDVTIYTDDTFLKNVTDNYIYIVATSVSLSLLLVCLIVNLWFWIKDNYRQRELKEDLEDHIQKGLTESLHHEIGNPVQAIWSILEDYFSSGKYKCFVLNGFQNVSETCCKVCNGYAHNEVTDEEARMFSLLNFNFERITSVLSVLSKSKNVKYASHPIAIKDLLNLTIASKEKLHLSNVDIKLRNGNLIKSLYLDNGFENGLFVNIINSLLTNSLEANANAIEIKAELEGSGILKLFIRDNGHGVIDTENRLVNSNVIFKYGYSTKDKEYNKLKKSWFSRFKNKLLCIDDQRTTRGFGLSINRDILTHYDGELSLYSNSYKGATFLVVVRVYKDKKG